MPVIVAIQPHLIRINHVVIIPYRQFLITHALYLILWKTSALRHQPSYICQHLVFQSILQCSWPCDTWAKLQYIPIIPHEFIRIPRHIWTRPHETHIANQHIPQPRQLVQFPVTAPLFSLGVSAGDTEAVQKKTRKNAML